MLHHVNGSSMVRGVGLHLLHRLVHQVVIHHMLMMERLVIIMVEIQADGLLCWLWLLLVSY